jgi:hypothetical protein
LAAHHCLIAVVFCQPSEGGSIGKAQSHRQKSLNRSRLKCSAPARLIISIAYSSGLGILCITPDPELICRTPTSI